MIRYLKIEFEQYNIQETFPDFLDLVFYMKVILALYILFYEINYVVLLELYGVLFL